MQGRRSPACIYELLNKVASSGVWEFKFEIGGNTMLVVFSTSSNWVKVVVCAVKHEVLLIVYAIAVRAARRFRVRDRNQSLCAVSAVS